MTAKFFPHWLSPRDKAIANSLLEFGCWFAGNQENFCDTMVKSRTIRGWKVAPNYHEYLIDIAKYKALFCCDIQGKEDGKACLVFIEDIIVKTAKKWDRDNSPGRQLSLFQ
jgi:hypothetical protein